MFPSNPARSTEPLAALDVSVNTATTISAHSANRWRSNIDCRDTGSDRYLTDTVNASALAVDDHFVYWTYQGHNQILKIAK